MPADTEKKPRPPRCMLYKQDKPGAPIQKKIFSGPDPEAAKKAILAAQEAGWQDAPGKAEDAALEAEAERQAEREANAKAKVEAKLKEKAEQTGKK